MRCHAPTGTSCALATTGNGLNTNGEAAQSPTLSHCNTIHRDGATRRAAVPHLPGSSGPPLGNHAVLRALGTIPVGAKAHTRCSRSTSGLSGRRRYRATGSAGWPAVASLHSPRSGCAAGMLRRTNAPAARAVRICRRGGRWATRRKANERRCDVTTTPRSIGGAPRRVPIRSVGR